MPFSIFDIIYAMLLYVPGMFVMKVLTQDLKPCLKGSVYLILLALLYGITTDIIIPILPINFVLHNVLMFLLSLCLFVYFQKIKSCSGRKSAVFVFLVMLIGSVGSLLVFIIINVVSPGYIAFLVDISFRSPLYTYLFKIPFLLANGIIVVLGAFLFVRMTRSLRKRVNRSDRAQTVLAIISIALAALMQFAATAMQHQREFVDFITFLELLFLVGFAITTLASIYFYTSSINEKSASQQKEAVQEALQIYTKQIEQQQTAMRKFKHDYVNILLSMDGFFAEDNIAGLKDYYANKVRVASEIITKGDFALENLCNINVLEIKGLLGAKLMRAQDTNMNICVTFEATEEIDGIPIDSIVLVRMLGIIMDNAIEELGELGGGQLMVACYKEGTGVVFVVQNTCRADIPKLQELKQAGFSTKGEGRGQGLCNLSEMVAAHSDRLTLHTSIEGGYFKQRLWIGDADNVTHINLRRHAATPRTIGIGSQKMH